MVWALTRRWRRMTPTPLSRFSGMLYELYRDESELDEQDVAEMRLAERFAAAYEGVRAYPHGAEVADSFATMDVFLQHTSIEDLATAHQQLAWIQSLAESLLRPAVIRTLTALGDVSREVVVFTQSTSPARQSAALNRANGALGELATFVQTHVLPPERVLLKRIVQHWQTIIAAEQGKLGQAALREMLPSERLAAGHVARESTVWEHPIEEIANPYVVGDPVFPPLFVGRGDILARIASLWSTAANADSIILYGHRRMGKSSLLRNLDQAAPSGSIVAYVDLQGETSFVASTADLLAGLANRIYSAVRRALPDSGLVRPEADAFTTPARAQLLFDQFMEQVRDVLAGRRLILALDEFEAIDYAVRDHKIGRDIYTFLRARKQEPWLAFVLGGLHTLDEMSRDYQEPFYGSYTNIQVSYLSHDAAAKLIAGPTPDFDVNYEPAAIERIIAETGGQPYLVQLICRDALDHLNHELFDEHKEREVKILLTDVEAVLGAGFLPARHGLLRRHLDAGQRSESTPVTVRDGAA